MAGAHVASTRAEQAGTAMWPLLVSRSSSCSCRFTAGAVGAALPGAVIYSRSGQQPPSSPARSLRWVLQLL